MNYLKEGFPIWLNEVKTNFMNTKNFDGKIGKDEFWKFMSVQIVVSMVISVVTGILARIPLIGLIASLVQLAFTLVTLLPSLSFGIKRLRDIGKEWFWVLIPIYNLYLWWQPSSDETKTN